MNPFTQPDLQMKLLAAPFVLASALLAAGAQAQVQTFTAVRDNGLWATPGDRFGQSFTIGQSATLDSWAFQYSDGNSIQSRAAVSFDLYAISSPTTGLTSSSTPSFTNLLGTVSLADVDGYFTHTFDVNQPLTAGSYLAVLSFESNGGDGTTQIGDIGSSTANASATRGGLAFTQGVMSGRPANRPDWFFLNPSDPDAPPSLAAYAYTAVFSNVQSVAVTAVPEPSTYALMLAGLGVVGFAARRRQQRGAA
jgi:hypothetical protein